MSKSYATARTVIHSIRVEPGKLLTRTYGSSLTNGGIEGSIKRIYSPYRFVLLGKLTDFVSGQHPYPAEYLRKAGFLMAQVENLGNSVTLMLAD